MGEIDDGLNLPEKLPVGRMRAEKRAVLEAILNHARVAGWANMHVDKVVAGLPVLASRASVYRWYKDVAGADLSLSNGDIIRALRGGAPEKLLERVKKARVKREPVARKVKVAAKAKKPAKVRVAANEIKARAALESPMLPTIEETAAVMVPIPVMQMIQVCIQSAREVMDKSRGTDGTVRNAKLMLMASEQLRRSLDTAVKLQEAISDGLQIERFHKTILDEIAKIDPDLARRVIAKLGEVEISWAGRNEA